MNLSLKLQNHFTTVKTKSNYTPRDIISDYVFERLFCNEARLSDFLKSILVGKNKVFPEGTEFEKIEYLSIRNKYPDEDRTTRFNIQITTTKSESFLIKIQKPSEIDFLKRTEFYGAHAYSHPKNIKNSSLQEYLNASPVVVISLIRDKIFDDDVPCVSYHFTMEGKTKKSYMKAITHVFIELGKFGDDRYDQSNIDNKDEEEWLELMKFQDTNREYSNKQVNSAVDYVNRLGTFNYDEYIRSKMQEDIENNLFSEGKRESKIEIAERMLDDGISIEKIMSLTDLSKKEVEEIIRQMSRNSYR